MYNTLKNLNDNLFLHYSDTELTKFCEEVLSLGRKYPEIHRLIKADQDRRGKQKKQLRKLDRQYQLGQIPDLPDFDREISELSENDLELETGRPRMKAEHVLLFLCLRGYFGSVTDWEVCDRIRDSMTLYALFGNQRLRIPAPTTILENINCLSGETRDYIMRCQLADILADGLDDFSYLLFDSTSVEASSCWPTDAGVISRLLERVYVYGRKIERFGIQPVPDFYLPVWFKELKELLFKINNARGTRQCSKKKKIKSLYRNFLKTAHKANEYLLRMFELRSVIIKDMPLRPSVKLQLLGIHRNMEDDLQAVSQVLYYTKDRILNDVVLPSSEKVLSLSDSTAAFIKKGQRNPVIGYKPQLTRSGNGFVTAMLLEQGNTSDSASLLPLTKLHKHNTGVIPGFVSADDGYSSKEGFDACLRLGVENICLSGSKGKKIIPGELWESEAYIAGRKNRSAVESLMFTLKYVFGFGRMRRRGLENVRAEMTEKVIAYNIRRKLLLQKQLEHEIKSVELKESA